MLNRKSAPYVRYYLLAALFAVAMLAAVAAVVGYAENGRYRQTEKANVLEKLSTVRAKLEGAIVGELLLSRALETMAYAKGGLDQPTFDLVCAHFIKESKYIRSIGWAKGTSVTYVYPLKGNEKAIGLDYSKNPAQWTAVKRAMETGKTVLAGPVNLVQGGVGIIGRIPIFLQVAGAKEGRESYFGLLSVVMDIPKLFDAAGISSDKADISIAIRGKDGLGREGEVFHGDPALFSSDSVMMELDLAGNRWVLAAVPSGGWAEASPRLAYYRLAIALVGAVVLGLIAMMGREAGLRWRSKQELVASEARFRSLIENAPEAILLIDADKREVIEANSRANRLFGVSTGQLLAHGFSRFYHPEQPDGRPPEETIAENMANALRGEETVFERRISAADGREAYCEVRLTRLPAEDRNLVRASFIDITERKAAETELANWKALLTSIVDSTGDLIWSVDAADFGLVFFNRAMREHFARTGRTVARGMTPDELMVEKAHAAEWRGYYERTLREKTFSMEYKTSSGDRVLFLSFNALLSEDRTFGISVFAREITEKRRLEEHLAQAQKMEAIGTLAGGIAHDFNNILSAIVGYSELAIQTEDRAHRTSHLEQVLTAAGRAAELVKQILTFSRMSKEEAKPLQPRLIIAEALKLLRASIPATVEIRQRLVSSSVVLADPGEIHRIVVNLATNAALAMEENGGLLEVGLENVDLDAVFVAGHPGTHTGSYVRLTVKDTGVGMPPEVMERIFDPYFTTRGEGKGTGMGLAVVHGIVKSRGGAVSVVSEVGKGTTFQVYLPIEKGVEEAYAHRDEVPATGTERILFVDDDAMVAEHAGFALGRLGYRVETFTKSEEALRRFKRGPADFDLVITDMTMPGMTGDQLALAIREIRPDVPVIICTGYSAKLTAEKAAEIGINEYLMKPVATTQLSKAIRKVMGAGT